MNTIYLLSNEQNLTVEKFHFCSWDARNGNTFVETGISIRNTANIPATIDFYLALPFLAVHTK
jgi:hypothetical protein